LSCRVVDGEHRGDIKKEESRQLFTIKWGRDATGGGDFQYHLNLREAKEKKGRRFGTVSPNYHRRGRGKEKNKGNREKITTRGRGQGRAKEKCDTLRIPGDLVEESKKGG